MLVVGIYGCTCAGKSTLCEALVESESARTVELDAFRWSEEEYPRRLPPLDLTTLDWPSGQPPAEIRKSYDTNVPEWVDWEAAERAVGNAITAARRDGVKYLFVEGFLITTQPRIMAILDHLIYLHVSPEASQVLLMRKWTRSHFNKTSYQDKGVSLADFTCFWEGYVFARYQQHIPKTFPQNTITIDCMLPTNDAVAAIRAQLPRASD